MVARMVTKRTNKLLGPAVVFLLIGAIALILHLMQPYVGRLELRRPIQESAAVAISGSTGYPRRVTDQDRRQITIPQPTKRVASQYWSIDELLYAVLPPEYVVGVSEYAYDSGTSNVLEFAHAFRPTVIANPEAVFTARPDLVFVSSSARADLTDLLRQAGVPTYRMFTNYVTVDEIAANILLTGYLTGQDQRASDVHSKFRLAILKAAARRPGGVPAPRVLGYSGRYTYGSQTSFNDVLRILGATNVAAEHGIRGYEAVASEQILRWNPEWLISRADPGQGDATLQRLLLDPAIALTEAAQKKQVLVLDNNVFLPMSPFTTRLIDVLSEAFYGNTSGS